MADPEVLQPLVCEAISRRLLMMFAYSDSVRVVEPHLCGVNSLGHIVLIAWMRPGYSRTDPHGAWRSFLLDRMWNAQTLPEHFAEPRAGFNPHDPRLQRVLCALPAPVSAHDDAADSSSDAPEEIADGADATRETTA